MQWISVQDALPEEGEPVLVFSKYDGMLSAVHRDFYWWPYMGMILSAQTPLFCVTHWIFLPAVPDQENTLCLNAEETSHEP